MRNSYIFETRKMIIEIKDCLICRIFNKLTSSEYVSASTKSISQDFASGLLYTFPKKSQREENVGVIGVAPQSDEESEVLVPMLIRLKDLNMMGVREIKDQSVEYRFQLKDGKEILKIQFSLEKRTGDLLISLRGKGEQKGLSAVRFALPPIICRGDLLLPVFNGIKACRDKCFKFESTVWEWPSGWQFPFIIFHDPLGGLWVYTRDTKRRFKEVRYRYEGDGIWSVAFDTLNYAPFNIHDSVESVIWRLNVYGGNWTIPVKQYKQWIYDTYEIKEKSKCRPSWVSGIKLVIKHADYMPDDQIVPFLELLSKYVDAEKTLLFMTNWMVSEPEPIIPNWVASEHGDKFNREARKRGFKTMYYALYFAITPNHPKFDMFKDHLIRNPYTNESEGWNLKDEWSEATKIKLYYVNPAYKLWRDYQIKQFKALFDKHPADGLFLDQSFLIFNDGNGLIDGQSVIEGNIMFHKELKEALPCVALGGESINEITMQYESFCELHFLSLEMKKDNNGNLNWEINPAAFNRMIPLIPKLILPYTRPMGYLGFPETRSSFYYGWRDALYIYKGIPTLTRPTIDEIKDSKSEVQHILRFSFPEKNANT